MAILPYLQTTPSTKVDGAWEQRQSGLSDIIPMGHGPHSGQASSAAFDDNLGEFPRYWTVSRSSIPVSGTMK